jgi:Sugar-specific transcriptional regulator TrmB
VEARMRRRIEQSPTRGWTFITKHAQVLLAVARDPDLRVREIADAAEITERYAYRVLRDLQQAGYVQRRRRGRCNRYRVNPDLTLGDPVVEEQSTRSLLQLIGGSADGALLDASLVNGIRLDRSSRGRSRSRRRLEDLNA